MQTLDSVGDTVYSSGGGVGSSRGVSRRGNSIRDGKEVAVPPRRFDQYPIYKDSKIEWLDKIPVHWGVKRLKFSAPIRTSKLDTKPDDKAYVGLKHVESWTGRLLLEPQPERVDGVMFSFRAGEVLLGKLRPYLAKVARPDFDGVCTSEILVLRPMPRCLQGYIMYFLLNESYVLWLNSLTYGAKMPRVSPEQVGNSLAALPPEPEQHAIAAFLDRETAKIDGLIERKERLIELLGENRTALITYAVTRGLDSTAPVKDSGIEWLDKIPAHWEVKRLGGTVIGCQNGVWGAEADEVHDIICVRVVDFNRVQFRVRLDVPTMRSIKPRIIETRRLKEHDLLLEKSGGGDKQPVGAVVMYDHSAPAVCSNFIARMPVAEGHCPRYITYLHAALYAAGINVRSIKQSTGIQNLDSNHYLTELVALPDLREQSEIAVFLDSETAKIDGLVAKVRQAIDLLKEYRVALISAAVTGKIDVREVAA